jgi:hypothetical protein
MLIKKVVNVAHALPPGCCHGCAGPNCRGSSRFLSFNCAALLERAVRTAFLDALVSDLQDISYEGTEMTLWLPAQMIDSAFPSRQHVHDSGWATSFPLQWQRARL